LAFKFSGFGKEDEQTNKLDFSSVHGGMINLRLHWQNQCWSGGYTFQQLFSLKVYRNEGLPKAGEQDPAKPGYGGGFHFVKVYYLFYSKL